MATGNKIHIDFEALAKEIYNGTITPYNLPMPLYHQTAEVIIKPVYKAFGGKISHQRFNSPDYKLLKELRTNVYMFSAAKTFQQVEAASKELTQGNNIRPFKEFRIAVTNIFGLYNDQYLPAEYQTAEMMGYNAVKYDKIQAQIETFPWLRYNDVDDAHECEICSGLHGIVARADDPFWDEFMPSNHFFCRCTVEQLEEGETDPDIDIRANAAREKMDPMFLMNPGKDKIIFKDEGKGKHPYFDVDKKYSKLAANNFNLPLPNVDTE